MKAPFFSSLCNVREALRQRLSGSLLQCLPESLLPDVCNVCRKAFNQMFAMFVGKPFTRCLQCLSESLSLVRPETGTGEVVVGPLGSACLQLNQAL